MNRLKNIYRKSLKTWLLPIIWPLIIILIIGGIWKIQNNNIDHLVHKIESLQSDIEKFTQTDELQLKEKLSLQKDLLLIEKDKINAQNAIYGTLSQTLGGIFFFITAYLSWRNFKLAEQKQVTERFSKAVEQLGSDVLAIQLGGIYALERIAIDSEQDHWTIMEVLTSFIRGTYPPNNEGENSSSISTSIQAALTVIGRRNFSQDPKDKKLDLSNTNLFQANLKGTYLREANLENADLRETYLGEANLSQANLNGAKLNSANTNTKLPVRKVDFSKAFLEKADLTNAKLTGANLNQADLKDACLNSANLYEADFTEAKLMNADSLFDLSIIETSSFPSSDVSAGL
ncbi:MAG: pentapeptide repeat-containing protein [Microcoleaceae cyanobacterium]